MAKKWKLQLLDSCRLEQNLHHIQKKEQRRRWSQDVHRKFFDALHRLGGSQVATPKQIRYLMKVDGSTNDEVKSHLQKYKMHMPKHPLHPIETLTSSDQYGLLDKEPQSLISLLRSYSPQSPHNGCHSSERDKEEEKLDRHSWKSGSEKMKKRPELDLEI